MGNDGTYSIDCSLTQKVKSLAKEGGADLVGIAPIERFKHAPEETKPTHYMSEATNVISIGIHIADGVCDVWGNYDEPGKTAGPYLFYGYGVVNLKLSFVVDSLAKTLESMKYRSIIFPPTWGVGMYRFIHREAEGVFLADFSHRHAAVAAGLGELGWHGLCITPQYGTRVRFCSVITNAPLMADPMYDGPKLCLPEKCERKCMQTCPVEAFSTEGVECPIGERLFKYSKIDKIRCFYGILGYVKGSGGRTNVDIPEGPGRWNHIAGIWEKKQNLWDRTLFIQSAGLIMGDFCGRCLRDCPAPFKEE